MKQQNELLKAEIPAFCALGKAFLNKEVSAAEFKKTSGGMGVYAQRGGEAFMLRLRTPSGVMTREHLRLMLDFAHKYDLPFVHFTTRQAVQLHDITIDAVCDMMDAAIDHGLYTRGGGGNFPRNVALSPLSGVERGEAFDVTAFALQAGEYTLSRMTEYHLPRKLKIAFASSAADAACSTINDLGFLAVIEDGKPMFRLFLAGGMGGSPAVGIPYDKLVAPADSLYHIEAMTRLFVAEGDYENKTKARTRFIPVRMGTAAFLDCYEKHLADAKAACDFVGLTAVLSTDGAAAHALPASPDLIPQRQDGLYTVVLHPTNGQMPFDELQRLAALLAQNDRAELRLSMTESLFVRNLSETEAVELRAAFPTFCKAETVAQSVSCIGVPRCQIGMEQSQALLSAILDAVDGCDGAALLPAIHVSGCGNSCSRHQVCAIGFTGKRKRVNGEVLDVFELHADGLVGAVSTRMGAVMGDIPATEIPALIKALATALAEKGCGFHDYFVACRPAFDALVAQLRV